MQKIIPFFVIYFVLVHARSKGQEAPVARGHVIVHQDSTIAQLIRRNNILNETKQSMPGYRIQVYFGTDRTKASEMRNNLMKEHPEAEVYLLYHQPNFKVRMGDYKTRLEAVKSFQLIAPFYPNAFIVKDDIRLPKLN